jgi:hypothetical protein
MCSIDSHPTAILLSSVVVNTNMQSQYNVYYMVLAMMKLAEANIRFCQNLGKSPLETLDLLHSVDGD